MNQPTIAAMRAARAITDQFGGVAMQCRIPESLIQDIANVIDREAGLLELIEALKLLLAGAEMAQNAGLNQPQVNGGIVLARAALTQAGQKHDTKQAFPAGRWT